MTKSPQIVFVCVVIMHKKAYIKGRNCKGNRICRALQTYIKAKRGFCYKSASCQKTPLIRNAQFGEKWNESFGSINNSCDLVTNREHVGWVKLRLTCILKIIMWVVPYWECRIDTNPSCALKHFCGSKHKQYVLGEK